MSTTSSITVSNPLVTMDVKTFMKNNGFTQVNREVKENQNGYPFITFINGKNEAENIYFSKGAAENMKAGIPIVKGFFDNFLIVETTNAQGEKRTKIGRNGDSTRLEMEDLF